MSIVALQKLLHILSNKLTAQFYMSVRSEQDGCRSYVPSICSCQNTYHAQIGIAIPDVELSSFDRFIFCFLIFKDPGNLRKGLDKKDKSSQDLDESFSTIYRLGWVIFNSLKTRMSHFQISQDLDESFSSLQDLDEVWHPVFGFWIRKDSGNLRKTLDWKGPRPAPDGKHA